MIALLRVLISSWDQPYKNRIMLLVLLELARTLIVSFDGIEHTAFKVVIVLSDARVDLLNPH